MVDRYTKVVLTIIALALTTLSTRALLSAPAVEAQQPPLCGTAVAPCYVVIAGGPPGGWQGAPLIILDSHRIVPSR